MTKIHIIGNYFVLFLLFIAINNVHAFNLIRKDVQIPTYNLTDSMMNAKYSSLAFCPRECVQMWNCKVSKQLPFYDPVYLSDNLTQTAGYIGYRPDTKSIILSLRGSSNNRNWWQNFNFEMIPYTRCKECFIHAGFYFDFSLLELKIYENIEMLSSKYEVRKIVGTGHSLGAALSLIAATEIKLRYGNKYQVQAHNFGQPRVGDVNLAQFMKNKLNGIFRVVHNRDLVPHVPFQWLKYAHPPNQIMFSADMQTYKTCNQSGQDPSCSNKFYPDYNPKDHDYYFMNIDSAANCKPTQQ